jgi:hypothetical protein
MRLINEPKDEMSLFGSIQKDVPHAPTNCHKVSKINSSIAYNEL